MSTTDICTKLKAELPITGPNLEQRFPKEIYKAGWNKFCVSCFPADPSKEGKP